MYAEHLVDSKVSILVESVNRHKVLERLHRMLLGFGACRLEQVVFLPGFERTSIPLHYEL